MPNPSILLSIAIPTFNRAAYLRECLESVRAALSAVETKDRCEVVVSDNASTDETASVVHAVGETMPIRYFRQPRNVGGHANFRAVAALANGSYVWILGDDDKVDPSAVGKILEGLSSGMGAIICNVAVYDRTFNRIITPRFLDVSESIVFHDPDRLMARVGIHAGYISAVILNRRAFLDVPLTDYRRFDRGGSCFMYAAYQVMHVCGPVLLLSEPLILNRGAPCDSLHDGGDACSVSENRRWNETFVDGFPQALAALRSHGYSAWAIRAAYTHTMTSYVLPRLMFLKNAGYPVCGLVQNAIRHMAASWAVWLLLVPLSLMPGSLLRRLRSRKRMIEKWLLKGAKT